MHPCTAWQIGTCPWVRSSSRISVVQLRCAQARLLRQEWESTERAIPFPAQTTTATAAAQDACPTRVEHGPTECPHFRTPCEVVPAELPGLGMPRAEPGPFMGSKHAPRRGPARRPNPDQGSTPAVPGSMGRSATSIASATARCCRSMRCTDGPAGRSAGGPLFDGHAWPGKWGPSLNVRRRRGQKGQPSGPYRVRTDDIHGVNVTLYQLS